MTMHTHTKGNRQPLIEQLDKLFRHNCQGSYRTRERYCEAMKRCYFLADEYHLQKLANISGKDLTACALRLQEEGKSPNTIKTDLSAIRFFHDKISNAKCDRPSNDELTVKLERRRGSRTPDEHSHRQGQEPSGCQVRGRPSVWSRTGGCDQHLPGLCQWRGSR